MSKTGSRRDRERSSQLRPWPLLDSKILQDFPIYRLRQDTRRSPRTGRAHPFLVIDSPDWINVVPVTEQGHLVLIRQFRHGTASFVWEIPGGMVDPGDPTPEHAARRELLEETGYASDRFHFLGAVRPNPAIQNNRCHTFLALDCRQVQPQALEGAEDIEVLEVPGSEIPGLIDNGEIDHALVLMAFFWYERFLRNRQAAALPPGESR